MSENTTWSDSNTMRFSPPGELAKLELTSHDITFFAKDGSEVLTLCEDGRFLIRGNEAATDQEVYEAFREFISHSIRSHLDRLGQEREEVAYRLDKLNRSVYLTMPKDERAQIARQSEVMTEYLQILVKRIEEKR